MTFIYDGPLFELFFSSHTVLDLVLRLCFAICCFFAVGHLIFQKDKTVFSADRVFIGIGLAFSATYGYSLLAWKLSIASPTALSIFFLSLVLAGLWAFYRNQHRALWNPAYLAFALILALGALAEIPRFAYFSEDLPQYAHFIHTHIQKSMIPQNLLPVGPEPLNYPSGVGVFGLLFSKFSFALKPLEFVYLLASTVMALVYLGIYQHTANKKTALFVIAALSLVCWGHIMPNRMFHGYGRAIVLPVLFYLAWLSTQTKASTPLLFWLCSLWGLITFAINPAIAPITLLLILVIFQRENYFHHLAKHKWHLMFSIFSLALVFYVDPYNRQMLFGEGVPSPNMRAEGYEFSVPHGLKALFVLPFSNFSHFWQSLLHLENTTVIFILALCVFATSKTKRIRNYFFGSGLVLLLYFVSELFIIPNSSALSLIKIYTRLALAHFLLLLLLALLGSNLHSLLKTRPRLHFAVLSLFFSVGLYGFISKAFWRRSEPQGNIASALQEYSALGSEAPIIALDNRSKTDIGEDWIIPRKDAWLLGLLENSKPAFYYWRGNAKDFGWPSYKKHICSKIDQKWLAQRGITHIFVAPHATCRALPRSNNYGIYRISDEELVAVDTQPTETIKKR